MISKKGTSRGYKRKNRRVHVYFFLILSLSAFMLTANIALVCATQSPEKIFSINFEDTYYTGTHNLEGVQQLSLWYAKINTPSISTLYVAYKSNDNATPPPFLSVLAQHFIGSNNTEIYFATSLIYMEFFNDTNGNGVLDYNSGQGTNEIVYTIVLNASSGVIPSDIVKENLTTEDWEIITYKWSYSYIDLQAILTYPDGSVVEIDGKSVTFFIRNFTLAYTLNISTNLNTNTTRYIIKQDIEILEPEFYLYDYTGYTKTKTTMFNDLGIALLFAATVSSNKDLSIVSNDNLINSSDPTFKETQIENASLISVEDHTKFIDLYLNDTYLLSPSNTTHEVKSAVYPKESIEEYTYGAFSSFIDNRIYDYIKEVYSEESVYDVIPNMTVSRSDFIYRISYAKWNGESIIHDPTIEAYPHSMLEYQYPTSGPGAAPPLAGQAMSINTINMILTVIFGILLAVFATYRRKKLTYPGLEKYFDKTAITTSIIISEYIEF